MRACGRPISIALTAAIASLGVVTLLPNVAHAGGPDVWTGAVNGNWGTAGNWMAGTVPASGDSVTFPVGAQGTVVVNVPNVVVRNISVAGTYIFNGNPFCSNCSLGFTGAATISETLANNSVQFSTPIKFVSVTSFTTSAASGGVLGLASMTGIAPIFNVTGSGNGATFLTAAGTYTATNTTIVSGRLDLLELGTLGTGPVTVDNGAEFDVQDEAYIIPNNLTISGGGSFLGGAIYLGQPGVFTGTVTLAGNAVIAGDVTIQNLVNVGANTLTVIDPYSYGKPTFTQAILGTGAMYLSGPGTFIFSGSGTTVPAVLLTSGASQILSVTGSMPNTSIDAPSGGLIEGAGTIGSVATNGAPHTLLGGSTVNNNAAGGVLTIASQTAFSPSIDLQVEDASSSLYGSVAVNSALNIDGATLLQPIDGTSLLGQTYAILTSTGALTGTFAGDPDGTIIQDNRGTDFVIHYLAHSVTLTDVGPLSTSFTAAATPASVPFGSVSTLSETGLPSDATGTVTFASGAATLCTATLPATTCTTSTGLTGGTYPITATYSGGGLYGGSTATTSLTVTPLPTSFSAAATPSSVPFGTTSTLSETGLPNAATGTVTFSSGGSTLCVSTLPTTTCTTSTTLAGGTYPIIATYAGDADDAGSTATTSLTVTAASTSFTASATPSSVSFGTSSILAATGLPGSATGTVTFTSGGATLCTATLPATTCPTATILDAGSYPITATYSGNPDYAGSIASTSLTVTPATTSFVADATPANVTYGTSSLLTESGLPAGATGTVTFASGGTTLCTATLPGTSCSTATSLAAGSYPITATYTGDGDYSGSSASTSLTVGVAPTSFTVSANPSTVAFGTSANLTATGLPAQATGTVTFASGASTVCVATLPATTCASAAFLAAGAHAITATYSGDGNYAGSTAATTLTVTLATTSTTVTSSVNPSGAGQRIVFTARVLPNPGAGTVSFEDNGRPLAGCAAMALDPLIGAATCSATYAAAGTHIIGAIFSGTGDYASSSAATSGVLALTETVDAAVVIPSTGAGVATNAGQSLAGAVLALLGCVTVWGAKRRRSARKQIAADRG